MVEMKSLEREKTKLGSAIQSYKLSIIIYFSSRHCSGLNFHCIAALRRPKQNEVKNHKYTVKSCLATWIPLVFKEAKNSFCRKRKFGYCLGSSHIMYGAFKI